MSPIHSPFAPVPPKDRVAYSHFDVAALAPEQRMLAWRERVGHVIDVLPTQSDQDPPLVAEIDRFQGVDLTFTDARTDALSMERSLARISVDREREIAFHVFLDGGFDTLTAYGKTFAPSPPAPGVLAVDLNQPFRMRRCATHMLTLFLPLKTVESVLSDPAILHGRMLSPNKRLTRSIIQHAAELSRDIRHFDKHSANAAMQATADMLLAGFGQQLGPRGNGSKAGDALICEAVDGATHAAIFAQVRRYIEANLHLSELTAEHVLQVFRLPRPTLYRFFQHDGGIGAYIRHARLRQAAQLLLRNPATPVVDIAYELGFNSASDFSRAFRRAFETTPRDYRLSAQLSAAP